MISKFKFKKDKIYILFLFLFSVIINQYYGNLGLFPMDSAHFFDSGYRVLNGEIPFQDYWLVKGVMLDYIQAIFFYLLGVNWQAYVFHASAINALITLSTFFVLKNFKLKDEYSFFYSLLFSILAYPSSGTPFIDHHSAFFSLLGIYSFLLGINNKRKIFWILIPIFFGMAFLSKQVPATYIILIVSLVLPLYALINKRIYLIWYTLASTILFIFIIIFFGKLQGISFSAFLDQHIYYPQIIGSKRFISLAFTFENIIGNFILIYLIIIFFIYINLRNLFILKSYIKQNNFYVFLILLFFTFSLILHQLLTKNQTFIFFIIPILCAFSHIEVSNSNFKFKKIASLIILSFCLFSTYKYHFRFNEERKFHELKNVNLQLAINAKEINKKLSGLKWITPQFRDNPKTEINLINDIQLFLKKDKRNKMLITNYPFYSIILDQKLFSPSRVYTGDGTTHPLKDNVYEAKYQRLMNNLIKKNKITVIYVTNISDENINFHYIDFYKNCFNKKIILKQLISYEIKNCSL
tara:strand:+ start:75 stop:1643 length:1569 start_codon:yes stop_codon:yes gene_type:complete